MTWLLAVTGEATIKIGPEWERLYDEVSAKYIGGKAYNRHGRSEAPFGAVYLRPKVYTAADYDELVANHVDHEMQTYMEQEQNFLTGIPDIAERTVVDIGAGHGRLVPTLAAAARNVVAVEIDGNMFTGLQETAKAYRNVEAIQGDALALPQLLKGKDVQKPVFVIAQNSLGTFEGNPQALLQTLSQLARQYDGEVVLSLLRQPALQKWGLHMYAHLAPMVGEADLDRTDPTKGQFVTKTGYRSKWWTDADIAQLISSGEVAAEQVTDKFHLLRIKY
jgi:SAM-dependent methyltransferase